MKRILVTVCIFWGLLSQLHAQHSFNNEIGTTAFRYEMNQFTVNSGFHPKFLNGIYFNYGLPASNWSLSGEAIYGENVMDDECRNCADGFYGRGALKEFNISAGVRYTIFRQQLKTVKPFAEIRALYTHARYTGRFWGGFSGGGMYVDKTSSVVGGQAKVGIQILPHPRIPVTISNAITIGNSRRTNIREETQNSLFGGLSVAELGVGYLF